MIDADLELLAAMGRKQTLAVRAVQQNVHDGCELDLLDRRLRLSQLCHCIDE